MPLESDVESDVESKRPLEGGCLCESVRYRVRDIRDAGFCHCSNCQKVSGSAFLPWAYARAGDFELLRGTPRIYRSSEQGERAFCPDCGSQLFYRDVAGTHVVVNLGTLDEPSAVRPAVHLFAANQVRWLKLMDLLPWVENHEPPPRDERSYLRGPADQSVSARSDLTLRAIDAGNLSAVLLLDVSGHQRRFVAPNAVSLAQAQFQDGAWARAIYADEVVVGFAMALVMDEDYESLPTRGEPFIWRFLIDERYQGLGLGRRAMLQIVDETQTWRSASALWVSCVAGTGGPYEFYRRLGFEDTGCKDPDGEIIMRRDY